jgi:hypothetical protein
MTGAEVVQTVIDGLQTAAIVVLIIKTWRTK